METTRGLETGYVLKTEYDYLKAENEQLRAALSEISNMGEGYDSAMVIVADKALRGE